METIEIGYFPVLGTRFHHQYLLYTPEHGPKQFLRGGPDVDGMDVVRGQSKILVEWGAYTPKVEDFNSNGDHRYATVLRGENLSLYWDNAVHQGRLINASGFTYYSSSQNSNSVIRTVAEFAGLQIPAYIDTNTVDFPGTQTILATDFAHGFVRKGALDSVLETVEPHCFIAGTEITMWDGSKQPIEEVGANDWVLSHDANGNPQPGRVARTFSNEAKIILDFHGTYVTPGHVYFCAGGNYKGRFAPLIDILRDDGAVQHEDGTLIRAGTGCPVASDDDKEFWAFTTARAPDGSECIREKKKLRLGTRWMLPNGVHFTMREYLNEAGLELLDDGYVRFEKTGLKSLFIWTFSPSLPSPEDYVLARSQTTLEDIYEAGQWEAMHPTMPVPLKRDSGPTVPLSDQQLYAIPRNTPMGLTKETRSRKAVTSRSDMN